MEDYQIIDLYLARSQSAVAETQKKYGSYCHMIAYNILQSREDSEECVNDTYLRAWNTIPPEKPNCFRAYLGKITRNLSLDRYRVRHAKKRGMGQMELAIDELSECVSGKDNLEQLVDARELTGLLNAFLSSLSEGKRKVFMRRYWYVSSVKEIAAEYGMSESKVKMTLLRTRNELRDYLEKEGVEL